MYRRLLLAPLLLLAACTEPKMPDAHVPPFAKILYEPFSREAVVAIALQTSLEVLRGRILTRTMQWLDRVLGGQTIERLIERGRGRVALHLQ